MGYEKIVKIDQFCIILWRKTIFLNTQQGGYVRITSLIIIAFIKYAQMIKSFQVVNLSMF